MYKGALLIFFAFFLLFIYPAASLSAEINLPKPSVGPDNYLFYSFKRLIEKTIIITKLSKQAKFNYYRELNLMRMAELKNVVDQKYLSEVQQATQRLSYQVGILTDHIVANRNELGKNISTTRELFTGYKQILASLRDQYPANSSFWMLVQHSINSIDLNLDKLK